MFAKGKRTMKRQRSLSGRIWLYLEACSGFGFLGLWAPVSEKACTILFGLEQKAIVWLKVEIVRLSLSVVTSDGRNTQRGIPLYQGPLRFLLGVKHFLGSQMPCDQNPLAQAVLPGTMVQQILSGAGSSLLTLMLTGPALPLLSPASLCWLPFQPF